MSHILLNCDWLGVSVKFPQPERDFDNISGHTWIEFDGTNIWRKRRILVNDRGEKVATVLYEPKSSLLDTRCGVVEISNEWLYHGIGPRRIIDMLSTAKPFSVSGINRLDLCVDFNPSIFQREVIYGLASSSMYVGGKRSGSSFWSIVHNDKLADAYQGQKIPHCQSWGHKTSNIRWKLYYKSKELLDDMGGKAFAKPYILDCWEEAKLDHKDVWRLEVSIHDCNQFVYGCNTLSWDVFYNCNPRVLFAGLYHDRFQVRRAEGHKDKTNDTRVDFLPINKGEHLRCSRYSTGRSRSGRITLLRHLIASCDDESVLLDDNSREDVLYMIVGIVERDGLQRYVERILDTDIYSWVETKRVQAYDLKSQGFEAERPKPVMMDAGMRPNVEYDIDPRGSQTDE